MKQLEGNERIIETGKAYRQNHKKEVHANRQAVFIFYLKVSAMAFKTEGFGVFGNLSSVSKSGICDVADDGSVCIDTELKVHICLSVRSSVCLSLCL